MKLLRDFYQRPTLIVAEDLLGKRLVRRSPKGLTAGLVVETEAYIGEDDPGCHAFKGRRPFCETMYAEAGCAYIYLTRGRYFCLNAVTERADFPSAVLIRAIEPTDGLDLMAQRRGLEKPKLLASGPSRLCIAMALTGELNGIDLAGDVLYVEDAGFKFGDIARGGRIGLTLGKEIPWRFFVRGNEFVSHFRRMA